MSIRLSNILFSELEEYRDKSRFLYGESMGGAVALLLHRKDPTFWDGAVLVAPMCKVSHGFSLSVSVLAEFQGLALGSNLMAYMVWLNLIDRVSDIGEGEAASVGGDAPDAGGGDHPQVEDRPHQGRHRLCLQRPHQARKGSNV